MAEAFNAFISAKIAATKGELLEQFLSTPAGANLSPADRNALLGIPPPPPAPTPSTSFRPATKPSKLVAMSQRKPRKNRSKSPYPTRDRSPVSALTPAFARSRSPSASGHTRQRSPLPSSSIPDSPMSPAPADQAGVPLSMDDDGFIVVTRKRPAASEPPKPPAKTACPEAGTDALSSRTIPGTKPPPPIFVKDKERWNALAKSFADRGIDFSARSTQQGIKVVIKSTDGYRAITQYLRDRGVGFHTFALEEEKLLRVVIRNVPKEIPATEVKEDLLRQNLPVLEVHRLTGGRTKTPFDLVLVVLERTPAGKAIFQVKTVCALSGVTVETPHKRTGPSQCHRCQCYGHAARHCNSRPRCVKCTGDHGTADCTRQKDDPTPPSCTLCGTVGHTANYRGCPKAPRFPKPSASRPSGQVSHPKPKPAKAKPSGARSKPATALPSLIPQPPVLPTPASQPIAPSTRPTSYATATSQPRHIASPPAPRQVSLHPSHFADDECINAVLGISAQLPLGDCINLGRQILSNREPAAILRILAQNQATVAAIQAFLAATPTRHG